jgi:hypothetical protein
MQTQDNQQAAFLTALAQDPSPTALGPVFAGIGYWPAWNISVVAGFDPASGYGCTECATEAGICTGCGEALHTDTAGNLATAGDGQSDPRVCPRDLPDRLQHYTEASA